MIWQFIINGLITGLLYSLLAIGFALVYNTTHIFHIAAAGIYVFAAYMFWWLSGKLGLPIIFAAALAISLTMGLSLLSEVGVYRPLRKKHSSLNAVMIRFSNNPASAAPLKPGLPLTIRPSMSPS